MEELIKAIYDLSEKIETANLPQWTAWVNLIVPIVLTAISIAVAIITYNQNKQLQKEISNRDTKNQTRQSVLSIYGTFIESLNIVHQADNCVPDVFVSDMSYYKWALEIEQMNQKITIAFNSSNIMLHDDNLNEKLRGCMKSFANLYFAVHRYVSSGLASNTISEAWRIFTSQNEIKIGDYATLLRNNVMAENFKKLCQNSYTDDIQDKINDYKKLICTDNFDNLFRKYVQID